jgi:hypothetical protein
MQIDHIFLRAAPQAAEAALLREFGLAEGSGNQHPGQGTENRRFFFSKAFIELLWISDASEIKSDATRPTMLYERLSGDVATTSPFGVCFRPSSGSATAPFAVWDYTPAYLPPGMTVGIVSDVPLSEPMWFFLEKGAAADAARQPLVHEVGVHEITSVAITIPSEEKWSEAAVVAMNSTCVSLRLGEQHLMEITFDEGANGQQHDFRPALPLVFHY